MKNSTRLISLLILSNLAIACLAEPVCFRSIAGAAAQSGTRTSDGFRLETLQFDPFLHASWATVRSCAHPERPGFMVLQASASLTNPLSQPAVSTLARQPEKPVMFAGKQVRLLIYEDAVRLEVSGVAQANAAVGDQVKVRLTPLGEGAEGRFAVGIARSANLVEVVR